MEEVKKSSFLKTLITIIITAIITTVILFGGLAYYTVKKNPFNLQACLISSFYNFGGQINTDSSSKAPSADGYDNPLLSSEQEKMLNDLGVDVGNLPTSIPPDLEACFVDKLGQDKVNEIKAGAVPGPLDIFKGKSCIE